MSSFLAGAEQGIKLASAKKDKQQRRRIGIGLGVGAGAALLAAGAIAASRPALRKHIGAVYGAIGKGGGHAVERQSALPAAAVAQAKEIAEDLMRRGIDPKKARIAISGTGGTGKSTLARALSAEIGMKPLMMDDVGKSLSGRDLTKWVKKNTIGPGIIAEQTHLLNQVDPDAFDAIIRVHKPMHQVKQQILSRGRGAAQLDVYNYDKLHKAIETAFDSAKGTVHRFGDNVQMKMKPEGGFLSNDTLRQIAKNNGVNMPATASRQSLVLAASHGEKSMFSGVIPYLKKKNIFGGGAVVAGTGGAAGTAAYHYTGDDRK